MAPTSNHWTNALVEAMKAKVKARFEKATSSLSIEKRLHHIQRELVRLESGSQVEEQVTRFIYIMTALIHHERYGGLKNSQVKQLANLGIAILQSQGIEPRKSRLSHLYADLHIVLGQIYRQEGKHWRAAWEQSLGHWFANTRNSESGFELLGIANRALRLGDASFAICHFREAERAGLSDSRLGMARLGLIKALRLAGRYKDCKLLIDRTENTLLLSESAASELRWEQICLGVQTHGKVTQIKPAVQRGKEHFQGTYFIEAYLWNCCSAKQDGWKDMMTIRYGARLPEFDLRSLGIFYRFAMQMERNYLQDIPLATRVRATGDLLSQAHKLLSVDKELLVWAASARWLARNKSFTLAALALGEFEAISLKLSDGTRRDALGIMSDMLNRDWYRPEEAETAKKSDSAKLGLLGRESA